MRHALLLVAVWLLGCPPALAAVDASWMLAYSGRSSTDLAADSRLRELVQGALPPALAAQVLPGLGGPPEPVRVAGQRYVSVSSCVPHACSGKAFLWVDTRAGAVLGAYAEGHPVSGAGSQTPAGWHYTLTLGPLDLPGAVLPAAAREALHSWIDEHDLVFESPVVLRSDGSAGELDASAAAPAKFHPPQEGPSFDCARAASRIETAICADGTLGGLDLQLAALYAQLRKTLSTLGERDQLRALQRQWLQHRGSRCAAAVGLPACLAEEYRQQLQTLALWKPVRPAVVPEPVVFRQLESRVRSVLVPAKEDQGVRFVVSDDGQRVFAASWDRPQQALSGARLQVFDVADPGAPHRLAQLPLGDLGVSDMHLRGGRLFIVTYVRSAQSPVPEGSVVLADVRNPQAPAVLGRSPVEAIAIDVAGDGSCFVALLPVRVPNPPGHVVTPEGRIEPGACQGSPPDSSPAQLRDRAGPDALVESAGKLFIRSTRGASTADREVSVAGGHFFSQSFLATADAVLAEVFDSQALTTAVVVLDTSLPAFDAERLRQVHAVLGEDAAQIGSLNPFTADELASRLAAAGAQQALGLSTDELRQQTLVDVLAGWGHWQAHSNHPAFAIATLQRVLAIDPQDSSAWRDLGDAARAALAGAPDAAERLRLTQIALPAYAAYRERGGRIEPGMADFIGFNATHEPQELCQRVSEYQRRGRLAEIAGVTRPADVEGNGREVWLDVTYEGTGHFPAVEATDGRGQVLQGSFGQGAVYQEAARQVSDIVLLAADGRVYAVFEKAGALLSVRDWSGREVCHFP
jgi:uncharacterized protein